MFRTSITEMSTLAMRALSSHWRAYSIEIHFLLKKKKKREEMKQTANIFDRQFNSRRKDSIETRKGRVQQKYAQWTKYCRTREAKHQIIERWGYVSHLYNIALFWMNASRYESKMFPSKKRLTFWIRLQHWHWLHVDGLRKQSTGEEIFHAEISHVRKKVATAPVWATACAIPKPL